MLKPKMRKAQIIGQIFIYILVAIVIGITAILGYKAISAIISKGCQAEQLTFATRLETLIEQGNSYRSVAKQSVVAPCDYETLCLVDPSKIDSPGFFSCNDKIIMQSVQAGIRKNIFVKSKYTIGAGYSEFIILDNPNACTCIKQKNKNFYLTLKGTGSKTNITET